MRIFDKWSKSKIPEPVLKFINFRDFTLLNFVVVVLALFSCIFTYHALSRQNSSQVSQNSTPTTLPVVRFESTEVGVIVADFQAFDGELGLAESNLVSQLSENNIKYRRVNHRVDNRNEAKNISEDYGATIIIWGEKSSAGVRLFVDFTPRVGIQTSLSMIEIESDYVGFDSLFFKDGLNVDYIYYYILGQIRFSESDWNSAIESFNLALRAVSPTLIKYFETEILLFMRGTSYNEIGKYREAINSLTNSISKLPTSHAYHNRGVVYINIGEYKLAGQDFSSALELDPSNPIILTNIGHLNILENNLGDALEILTYAIKLDSTNPVTLNNLGNIYFKKTDWDTAIDYYSQSIYQDNGYMLAYYNRGAAYHNIGEYNKALQDYLFATTLDPYYAPVQANLGSLMFDLKQYEDALTYLDIAIELDNIYVFSYLMRAQTYEKIEHFDEAIIDYQAYADLLDDEDVSLKITEQISALKTLKQNN
jgi:tetratricopeptide (TPR) repeat protein